MYRAQNGLAACKDTSNKPEPSPTQDMDAQEARKRTDASHRVCLLHPALAISLQRRILQESASASAGRRRAAAAHARAAEARFIGEAARTGHGAAANKPHTSHQVGAARASRARRQEGRLVPPVNQTIWRLQAGTVNQAL